MENMIRNCAVTFRRVCPRTWESLRSTEEASIRFCDSCQREVFLCTADDEAVQHAKQGHCIAKPMPSRTSLRSLVLGHPNPPPPPPTTDEAALEEEYRREAGKMLALTRQRLVESGHSNVDLREGRAEQLPANDGTFDAVLASLSLMYVIDRAAAAREMRRVLRPGGRFVAAVWAAAERCDIVLFQQTAGKFAPPPPVPGVGPGALADPTAFVGQLADVGITVRVETEELGFDFPDFELAWEVLAGVTTAQLAPERRQQAKQAVQAVMWPHGQGPRRFRNVTQFLVGRVAG